MVESAYIHIPFCKSKCHYCSFISFPKLDLIDLYIEALKKEIKSYYKGEKLKTLYFGGGTPSLLKVSQLNKILSMFCVDEDTEITLEINPDTVGLEYLTELSKTKINRLSIGCQTFDDDVLKSINRIHNSNQVIEVINSAKKFGFTNISLDLIYGLPNQTRNGFINDLEKALSLDIEHISLYGLKIDEGCYFYNNLPENLPDDDLQADMFVDAVNLLTENNFNHYEVSNFSKKGFNSKHNLTYWENSNYYGFGVAAHGYIDNIRYSNPITIEEYIENPCIHKKEHIVTDKEKLEEEIFLGFRKINPDFSDRGINIHHINEKFNIDFEMKYKDVLEKYLKYNLIKKIENNYILTTQGILLSNVVLADFIE